MTEQVNEDKVVSEPEQVYQLDDSVLHRVVQIVQEGLLTATDVADGMRQIRLNIKSGTNTLVLTPAYKQQVETNHNKMLDFIEQQRGTGKRLLTEEDVSDKATD